MGPPFSYTSITHEKIYWCTMAKRCHRESESDSDNDFKICLKEFREATAETSTSEAVDLNSDSDSDTKVCI